MIVLPTAETDADSVTMASATTEMASASAEATPKKQELSVDDVNKLFGGETEMEPGDPVDADAADDDCVIDYIRCMCSGCKLARGETNEIPSGSESDPAAPTLVVPSPAKGGQRKETQKVPQKRLFAKTTEVECKPAKGKPKAKGKQKKKKKDKKDVGESSGGGSTRATGDRNKVAPPAKIIERVKDGAAYILSARKVYVAQTSERVHGDKYMEGIQRLAEKINDGTVASKSAAREFLTKFFEG